MLKKILLFALASTMVLGMGTTAFAAEDNLDEVSQTLTTALEDPVYYDIPQVLSEEPSVDNRLLLSAEEMQNMSKNDLYTYFQQNTPLTDQEIEQIIDYYNSEDFKNGIAPIYGIYDHPEWSIKPYVKSSQLYVYYKTSWIGIDAYRSSVGMSKGKTETTQFSATLGFEGSGEIKKFKTTLKNSYSVVVSKTISESQTCPAWTTMNWRPYMTYYLDTYYGKMKITTIIPTGTGVYENVWYEDHTGTDRRKVTETSEVWSRVNSSKNVNASTPQPPTSAPKV